MLNMRPVSDLRNKYSEVERQLIETKEPIILTKNGVGSAVLMSIEEYEAYKHIENYRINSAKSIDELLLEDMNSVGKEEKLYTLEEVFEQTDRIIKDAKKRLRSKGKRKIQK